MYVSDTHSWLWHLAEDDRLGDDAASIFRSADGGEETILLPTVVVVESVYIAAKREYDMEMAEVVEDLRRSSNYHIRAMDGRLLSTFAGDEREMSIHDKIIVLTAEKGDAEIISNDDTIQEEAEVDTVW